MKSSEIRTRFFAFFEKHGHTKVASSSLIPAQDPTLLFANAGMNQFKDAFLGLEKRSYTRAVSIQKCVRAGGKHNDLDNVGFTKRHCTFFEMMGNFSFGDYFKKEAIPYAWDFLTQDLGLPTKNLYVSTFETDDESYNIWRQDVGLPKEKIYRLGESENFWAMGDIGPCGPSTEIHIDRGPEFGCKDFAACSPACECDRFLEIWNVVFMQYDRQPNGELKPLKQTGVDTGMGLERIASIMQDVDSVFHTDLFTPLVKKTEELTSTVYDQQSDKLKAAFHVLADHVRSTTLLIADGCAPTNEGRGYVLRKIIRRAALFEQKLTDKSIFVELAHEFINQMSEIYPELKNNERLIHGILTSEIEKFASNLVRGKSILEQFFKEQESSKKITGEQTFKLYDTFGFPIELVKIMADERGYKVDEKGFEAHMKKQQEQSGKKTMTDPLDHVEFGESVVTEFTGYQELSTNSEIIAFVNTKNQVVSAVAAGDECYVIARKSPYFIVGGGQVPDEGWLIFEKHKAPLIEVRYINGRIAPKVKAPVDLKVGDKITSVVDETWRTKAMKNHTATHMLQSALIEQLGKQIKQSGSVVHPDYLRFDFTYHENLSTDQIKAVEDRVNQKIMENIPVEIIYTTYKDAIDRGALAFFGDKYNPENVRMVHIPEYSSELCGGTHVPATGVIGTFKIVEVSALSAGHRRIVAVTGPKSLELFQHSFNAIKGLSQEFKVKREQVLDAVIKQKEQLKKLQAEIKQLKKLAWRTQLPQWQEQVAEVNGIPFLFLQLKDVAHDELKEIAAELMSKKSGLYVFASSVNERHIFFAMLGKDLASRVNLKNFAGWLKESHGIRGGGSPTMVQGAASKFDPNLKKAITEWLSTIK